VTRGHSPWARDVVPFSRRDLEKGGCHDLDFDGTWVVIYSIMVTFLMYSWAVVPA